MENQVVKYEVTDAAIAEMKDMYMGLVITDIDDAEQYDAVHKAHMTVRGKRIEVDKKRKELKADALEWGRKVQAEANRIFDLIEPIESHLKAEKQKVADEKQRIEDERIAGIKEKMDHLKEFRVYDPRLTTVDEIKKCIENVEGWEIEPERYFEFTTEANEIKTQILLENSKMLDMRIELDKEEAERKAEAERQAKVAAEQAEIAAKLKAQQDAIDEANREIAEEKAAIEAKKKAEQERRDREEAERKAKVEATTKARSESLEQIGFTYPFDDLGTMPDSQYSAMYEEHRKAYDEKKNAEFIANLKAKAEREAAEKAEAEKRRKEEAIRQEMLKPDKEKLIAFAQFLAEGITYPNTKDPNAKKLAQWAYHEINEISETVLNKAKKL